MKKWRKKCLIGIIYLLSIKHMNNKRFRLYIFFAILSLSAWFLFSQKEILAPFIIAMIFAYVFNPLINLFNSKLKIPRSLSIIIVYLILIITNVFLVSYFFRSILFEVESIRANSKEYAQTLQESSKLLPDFVKPLLSDYVATFSKNQIIENFAFSPFPFVSKAFSGILGFFVFIFSAFFFLKDGRKMADGFIALVPKEHREKVGVLIKRINQTLSSYLRGQMLIILSMFVMVYLGLTILGVKYALTIALFTAVLEIVPFVGPLAALIFSAFLVIVSGGNNNFGLNFLQAAVAVILVEYAARLIQDYLLAPTIIGKAVKIHPLTILFSVIVGEHVFGILGVLLAVPVAASLKILYQFVVENIEIRPKL